MPIGMPGWPDFAASTASIASARIELASSASEALAVTEESIGVVKLYSADDRASLPLADAFRAAVLRRSGWRVPLVRVLRRQAAGRDGPAGEALRRPAGARTPGLGQAAVAEKPQLVGCRFA